LRYDAAHDNQNTACASWSQNPSSLGLNLAIERLPFIHHHKPLTMHEFNNCSGGCVSRKFRVRHGPHAAALPLLQRSPNILLTPGTTSVEHLRVNGADGISDPPSSRTRGTTARQA
jgi:hypothetical protein